MTRRTPAQAALHPVIARLDAALRSPLPVGDKLLFLESMRGTSPEIARAVDEYLVGENSRMAAALEAAGAAQSELRALAERLTAPPYHPAVYLGSARSSRGEAAVVFHGGARRAVAPAPDVELGDLAPGDEVLLGPELNNIVGRLDSCFERGGETAAFDRVTPDGRVVVRYRDEELVLNPAGSLDLSSVRAGDEIRWSRATWLAYEKLSRSDGTRFFLEETPGETFADIGGLDAQIEMLKDWIRLRREYAHVARKYRVVARGGILLHGPVGTGKTLMARGLSNYVGSISPSGRSRFAGVKPGGLHSMWYSQSEANYREIFRAAREAARAEPDVPVVLFFDEVDAIGAARGESLSTVNDRVLPAFMAELDGLNDRGDVIVLAATNRPDALDPALLRPGRLGDALVHVPRPDRKAAREILGKHVAAGVPFADDGRGADPTGLRIAAIESTLSRLYAPNGGGEIATIVFRDASRRPVTARDVVSGAVLARIGRDALERACLREVHGGSEGVRLDDLFASVDAALESAVSVLTPANCRRHIDGLPQDLGVAAIEPVRRAVRRPHDYVRAA